MNIKASVRKWSIDNLILLREGDTLFVDLVCPNCGKVQVNAISCEELNGTDHLMSCHHCDYVLSRIRPMSREKRS
jgi:hypothetical protein